MADWGNKIANGTIQVEKLTCTVSLITSIKLVKFKPRKNTINKFSKKKKKEKILPLKLRLAGN